jgi:hypothetical protein
MTWMRIRGWIWVAACVALSARAPGLAAPSVAAPGSSPGSAPGAPAVPASDALSSQQIASVAALARAAALVRYLHPSDQAAALDWDAFLPAAIDRVLRASDPDPAALLAELRAVFAPVAPTAVFSMAGDPPAPLPPARGATHLARWRRYGPGTPSPYPSFREGRSSEADVAVSEVITAPLANPGRCRAARVNAVIRRSAVGTVDLVLRAFRPGQDEKVVVWPVTYSHVVFPSQVPPDTQEIELGVRVDGRASATLESLTLTCAGGPRVAIDPAAPGWRRIGPTDLHTWRTARCATGRCATLARNPLDRTFVAERDLLGADLGGGIRLDLPLAVWATAARTLPAVGDPPRAGPSRTPSDPRVLRLASVAAAWGALAVFYPYFQDQRIDWGAALGPALAEAAAARDAAEQRTALRHLLAELHDGHARLLDPSTPKTGILPIAVRRFGDRITVTASADESQPDEYQSGIAPGSELVAIDGVPARVAYDRAAEQISAPTDGLRAHLAAIDLGAGMEGALRWVRLRSPDGADLERGLPLVSREHHDHAVRLSRPWPGTEVAPGVFYVNFDDLEPETWASELRDLATARALIFDFRGYSTTGLKAVSHLIAHRIDQLTWQIPELPHPGRASYTPVRRSLYPISPRLTAPVVALVDGQSSSVVEATLAMIREHHLGLLVGEPTAGTSGLISGRITIPGGYGIRFTAVRLTDNAGATLHGRGIAPDIVVHPTLDGVRAGRDEIREAGLAAALRLAEDAPIMP